MKKGNRIPRNAKKIYFSWLIDTTGNTESHKTAQKRPATIKGEETHDRSRKRRKRAIMKATCHRPAESRRTQTAAGNYFFQDRSGSG